MSCSKRLDSHSINPEKKRKLPACRAPEAISLLACTSPAGALSLRHGCWSESLLQDMLIPGIPSIVEGHDPSQEAGFTASVYARGHFFAAFQVPMAMKECQGLPRNPVGRKHAPKVYLAGCKAFLDGPRTIPGVCLHK